MTGETDNAAPIGLDGAEAPDTRTGPACSSATNDPEELRKPRARTLEVIGQSISYLVRGGGASCLWVTVTFPPACKARKARQERFDSWRKHFLNG